MAHHRVWTAKTMTTTTSRQALNIHSGVCRRCLSSSHSWWCVSRNLRTQSSWHVDSVRRRHAFSAPVNSHTVDIRLVNSLSVLRSHAGDLELRLSEIINSSLNGSQKFNAEISHSICYHRRMRHRNSFGRIYLCVCLSVCNALTFESIYQEISVLVYSQ